jgi:hypothetical protein
LCGCAFLFFGFETGRKTIATVDLTLEDQATEAGNRRTGLLFNRREMRHRPAERR